MSEDKSINPEMQGMKIYETIVDSVDASEERMGELIAQLAEVDMSGQFLCSTARYLAAANRDGFDRWIGTLVERAIVKDRDRRYIGSLLEALWGADFKERSAELSAADDNFRRIYKRIYLK